MALLVTNSIVGQSVGTAANVGDGLFPQKITLGVGCTQVSIAGRITNGAAPASPQQRVVIRYIISPFSVSAVAAVLLFRNGNKMLELTPSPVAADATARVSDVIPNTGGFLYYWADCPNFPVAGTLDVSSSENP